MAKIEKKVWKEYFEKILSGDKKFELRLADWDCNIGDTLVLKEWDNEKNDYTGRSIEKTITYIVKTKNQKFWTEEEVNKFGFQILGFK